MTAERDRCMPALAPLPCLLGSITPAQFLNEYWQKKPLLIRQAIPDFKGVVSVAQLKKLIASEDVESRWIQRQGRRWTVQEGPFRARDWNAFSLTVPWTVLVQDLNIHRLEADRLLRRFHFVPWARVDDLMVSYATPGGGVGPHVDSYDVFLLQGPGRRRWRISRQSDLRLMPNQALKLLKAFKPEDSWILEPGDMLYLPPNVAHEGVALSECFTYSIGFRAPSNQAWMAECLMDRAERGQWSGQFEDPNRALVNHPGELPMDMVEHLLKLAQGLAWHRPELIDFNGRYLTEPKPQVFFEGPAPCLTLPAFKKSAKEHGLSLDPKTRLLFYKDQFWWNGASEPLAPSLRLCIEALADHRECTSTEALNCLTVKDWRLVYGAYCSGFLRPETDQA